jgi:hypothetical protein
MAKVTFCCDSGANIHSCREDELDTVADLGLDEGEWEAMTEDEKQEMVNEWAHDRLEIYWKEEE